jgi:serine protease Do
MQKIFLFSLLFCILCLPLFSHAADLSEVIPRIKPSVVAIGTFQPTRGLRAVYTGTGFVVADGRHVVTNSHVASKDLDLERRESLAVFPPGDGDKTRILRAKVIKRDDTHDLCLLRFKGNALPPLKLGRAADVREGQFCAFTGFPIGMVLGLRPVTHRAMISAITPAVMPAFSARQLTPKIVKSIRAPFNAFQLDAVALPGNSGSPVYDQRTGKVIGVVNSVFVKGTKEAALSTPSGISYAIPVNFVRDLLREAGLRP